MPRLRSPRSGVVVNVSDGTASRLGWPSASEMPSEPADDDAPPKAGRGSSRQAWADYADTVGVDVHDDMTRDDIIEAVEGV